MEIVSGFLDRAPVPLLHMAAALGLTVFIGEYTRAVEALKQVAGITEATLAAARNSGRRRTPEKQELLRRIRARACMTGIEPLQANL